MLLSLLSVTVVAAATSTGIELNEPVKLSLSPVVYQQQSQPVERPERITPRADDRWGFRDGRFGPRMGDWEFLLGGGGVTPHNFRSANYNLSFSLGHYVSDSLELVFRQTVAFSDVGESDLRGSSRGAVDWHFGDGRWRPFVGVNFGGVYGDGGDTWLAGPEAGLKWFVHPQTFIMLMGEYQIFFDRVRDVDDNARRGDFVFSLGIGFLF